MRMKVWGTASLEVYVDPISIIEEINVLPNGAEWIKVEEKDGKTVYSLYEEAGAGSHSFDHKIGETTKEVYDLYMAKELFLKHLTEKEKSKK